MGSVKLLTVKKGSVQIPSNLFKFIVWFSGADVWAESYYFLTAVLLNIVSET